MSTLTKISDELWDDITDLLPDEKPRYAAGRPVNPFRKVINGILYVLRTGCQQWKMLPKEYGLALLLTVDFSSGLSLTFSKRYG